MTDRPPRSYDGKTGKALVSSLSFSENMNQVNLTAEQKSRLLVNMQRFGGRFVNALALAMIAADPANFQRLCVAFPEIVEKYLNEFNKN